MISTTTQMFTMSGLSRQADITRGDHQLVCQRIQQHHLVVIWRRRRAR